MIEPEPVNEGEAYSGNITLPREFSQHLENENRRVLKQLDDITGRFSTPVSTRLLHGRETAQVLIEEATTNRADLVVMATHSRSGVPATIFGSVAQDVTKKSGIPVLMVHPEHAPAPTELPVGAYVFTSDGGELGKLTKVSPDQVTIKPASGQEFRLSARDASAPRQGASF